MDNISASAATIRSLHHNLAEIATQSLSQPSSPRSSALPSPPDSPSDSVSSFPSVSSSFFFSSAAASPPHGHGHPDRDSTQGLIIPSLTLPAALRRPTVFGQTIGDIKLLVLGSKAAGRSYLSGLLIEDNEDVVEAGIWEQAEYGSSLRASTDWIEHRDAHGLEKFEPSRNVELIELPEYDDNDDPHAVIQSLVSVIQTPFYSISELINPKRRPCPILANLISSPSTPLYTALIFLLPSSPSAFEQLIIDNLGPQIPIIVLPRQPTPSCLQTSKLSSFRPTSAIALRTGLFRSPETLSTLRNEATDGFLRWREVERAVDVIHSSRRKEDAVRGRDEQEMWSKAKWESDWETSLSHDVARRLRRGTLTEKNLNRPQDELSSPRRSASCVGNTFDPLHLPSLLMISVSLLGPLHAHIWKSIVTTVEKPGVAFLGGFCVGIGVGLLLR